MKEKDHVHKNENGKWYFWDETEYYEYGPFKTEEIAREEIKKYADHLNMES